MEENKKHTPYNLEAEQAILGSLLYNNLLYEKISFLKEEHFYNLLNREIFRTIITFIQKGLLATPITIAPIFKDNITIKELGGEKFWVDLVAQIGPIAHIGANAKHIYDLFLRREMIELANVISENATTFIAEKDAEKLIEEAEVQLFTLVTNKEGERKVKTFKMALNDAVTQAEKASKRSNLVGVGSGLDELDKHLGGLHPSDLLILAGRPSMGKTALATTIAFNAARIASKNKDEGGRVAFFSLEMSAEQLALRILGQETGITSDRIRRGAISQREFHILEEKAKELYEIPLFIDDMPALTMAGLRTRARRLQRQENISLIVIDYLQLLSMGKGSENRVQELSEITRGLKALAKELNVPVLALSQLSRAVEQREDKQPQLSDLRESGSIEQDADVVMFVYRQAYYEARKKPPSGSEKMQEWQATMSKVYNVADLIIAKQRHGPIGTIPLHFDENTTKFSNLNCEPK